MNESLFNWLVGWPSDSRLNDCFINDLNELLVDCLIDMFYLFIYLLNDRLNDWVIDRLIEWMIGQWIEWMMNG